MWWNRKPLKDRIEEHRKEHVLGSPEWSWSGVDVDDSVKGTATEALRSMDSLWKVVFDKPEGPIFDAVGRLKTYPIDLTTSFAYSQTMLNETLRRNLKLERQVDVLQGRLTQLESELHALRTQVKFRKEWR
jgi:hypothetical protein